MSELVPLKIPALRGKDAKTNIAILQALAIHGPKTIWETNGLLGRTSKQYPTVFRAVNRLERRGYLTKTGRVRMKKRKTEFATRLGISFRGLIASCVSLSVRNRILDVLEKNQHIDFPFDDNQRKSMLSFVRAAWDDKQIATFALSLLVTLIRIMPDDIESIETDSLLRCVAEAIEKSQANLLETKANAIDELLKHPDMFDWYDSLAKQHLHQLQEDIVATQRVRDQISKIKAYAQSETDEKGLQSKYKIIKGFTFIEKERET
jgi:hypothetical protein